MRENVPIEKCRIHRSRHDQWGVCHICDRPFMCTRSDANTCSARCRKALQRICDRIRSGQACPSLSEMIMEYMERRERRGEA